MNNRNEVIFQDDIQQRLTELDTKVREVEENLDSKVNELEKRIKDLTNISEQNKSISQKKIAVELILKWATSISASANLARKFVEGLEEKECISLFEQKRFEVMAKHKNMIKGCLADIEIDESEDFQDLLDDGGNKTGEILLSFKVVGYIRWEITSYLNLLEAIMIAWQEKIADKKIIESQFRFLVSNNYYALEKYRKACNNVCGGVNVYPAIDEFVSAVRKNINGSNSVNQDIIQSLLKIEELISNYEPVESIKEPIRYLEAAKQEAQVIEPNKGIIQLNIQQMHDKFESTSKTVEAAKRLWGHIKPISETILKILTKIN